LGSIRLYLAFFQRGNIIENRAKSNFTFPIGVIGKYLGTM
jgi:hypothetical protein